MATVNRLLKGSGWVIPGTPGDRPAARTHRLAQKGFTLVELLAVMAIIGILAGVVAGAVTGLGATGQNAQIESDTKTLETAADRFFNESFPQTYPVSDADTDSDGSLDEDDTPPLPAGLVANATNEVANRLHSLAIHLLRRARTADRETGLSPERLSILSVLVFAGPQTLSQLAAAEQVSRPAISRSAKALVDEGLARRERNSLDRRSVRMYATAAGQALLEAGRRRRLEHIAAELEQLTGPELDLLNLAADVLRSLDEL